MGPMIFVLSIFLLALALIACLADHRIVHPKGSPK